MSDYEAFVHELIGYIFKVQDKDDDNLSAEIICRKLYKYGLIENVNHEWRMKYRPKHRWPATVHNGRADKEDWQCITIKPIEDEPQTEPLPKAINGVKIADAVAWADKWLEDNPVSEMWDMIRTLRDATEWQDEPQRGCR